VSLYPVDNATFTLFTFAATGTIHLVFAKAVCTLHYAELLTSPPALLLILVGRTYLVQKQVFVLMQIPRYTVWTTERNELVVQGRQRR